MSLERRIREELAGKAARLPGPREDLPGVKRRAGRRRMVSVLAAGLVLGLVTGGLAAAVRLGRTEPSPVVQPVPSTATTTQTTTTIRSTTTEASTTTSMASITTTVETAPGTWRAISPSPLQGRWEHTAVWTGQEMLAWGGAVRQESGLADGAAYDPATDAWAMLPQSPIRGRFAHVAVWTGREMLVWGGDGGRGVEPTALADGVAYDPVTNGWRPLADSPLGGRFSQLAVWTGMEMLIWGGNGASFAPLLDGAAYEPAGDAWRPMAASPLASSEGKQAVWTGEELILWGGCPTPEGAAYDPLTDRWRGISDSPLAGRLNPFAFWSGREMVIWGGRGDRTGIAGCGDGGSSLIDGAAYDPAAETWRELAGSPVQGKGAIWTDEEMLVWGPCGEEVAAAYDPGADAWRVLTPDPVLGNIFPETVWTGREALVWGGTIIEGCGDESPVAGEAQGARYTP